ncbi:hypothetical protein Q5741_18570 [Paenibacillus sp. JX-17]|uniref:Uncharacterized protein n=1 Tax=Paenibacillus lacisoli TaxID=3064525 RepID=A0ABT9CIQ0_9BACL|nr:hypothetical protein [Paenibacillus sp. JX-17]MDO7908408.1 hypothetical protein [Paenibacillus sp. JX-17]
MLSDLERKLLRILFNYSAQHRHMPSMQDLTSKTGKSKAEIMEALKGLEKSIYIAWENKASTQDIKLLEGWERQPKQSVKSTAPQGKIDYWTQY